MGTSASRVIYFAAQIGRVILENGGETYRVEETARRVCSAFGVAGAHIYATPTMLIVSAAREDGENHSVMERIHKRRVNLDKIDAVNQLSRSIEADQIALDAACARLRELEGRREWGFWAIILYTSIASAASALLFQGGALDLLPAFFTGSLVGMATAGLGKISVNDFFIKVIGGAVATLAAWLFVLIGFGENLNSIAVAGILQLVPGLAAVNAIRDITSGDLIAGISRMLEALFVAIGIACGTAMAYIIISLAGRMIS